MYTQPWQDEYFIDKYTLRIQTVFGKFYFSLLIVQKMRQKTIPFCRSLTVMYGCF